MASLPLSLILECLNSTKLTPNERKSSKLIKNEITEHKDSKIDNSSYRIGIPAQIQDQSIQSNTNSKRFL